MRYRTQISVLFLVLALLGLAVAPGFSQTSRATITGIVTDPAGAAIASAKVDLTNEATNAVRSTESNAAGLYRFDAVDPGTYSLSVKQPGFTTATRRGLIANAGQTNSVDVALEIGDTTTTVEVVANSEALQVEAPVRGGSIASVVIQDLPYASRDAVSLALTLPGVSSNRFGFGIGTFSVNGARGRSNNFLIDGVDNNDTGVAGQAFVFRIVDAVQEVNVQTGNFDAEFGRAGGAVLNTITKSGTNEFHGSLQYLIDSTFDDAITNTLSQTDPEVQRRGRLRPGTEQWYGLTFGGPVIKNKTFFFGGWQDQRQNSQSTSSLSVPSAQGFADLQRIVPPGTSRNLDLYRQILGDLRAVGQFTPIDLGGGRGPVQFGVGTFGYAQTLLDRQWMIKMDHVLRESDQLSGRYIDGNNDTSPSTLNYPGFLTSQSQKLRSAQMAWTHIFSPSLTNEFRPAYTRSAFLFPNNTENELGHSLPRYTLGGGVTSIGVQTNIPQGRTANNYTIQNTISYVRGAHTLRMGLELFQQRGMDIAPARERGEIVYTPSAGYSIFGNFIDDFGGTSGSTARDFGNYVNYPRYTRQAYFFQDRWRITQGITLTLGTRYEYFGTPMNALPYAAFSGLFNVNPVTAEGPYRQPSEVTADKNNWAPVVGLTYSPSYESGILGRIFGDRKTVFRTGYQVGYDSFFNNILSNAATSTPNIIATSLPFLAANEPTPRGRANISTQLPTTARVPLPIDGQTLASQNLVNPYMQRWSFSIQRELPSGFQSEIAYVGTKGTKLFVNEDLNPVVPVSMRVLPSTTPTLFALQPRLDATQGSRLTRTNGGDSNYHALQAQLKRRFMRTLGMNLSYTWSKLIDNASEVFGVAGTNAPQNSVVPSYYGGLRIDRAVGSADRTHRLVYHWVYEFPWWRTQNGVLGRTLGGWQLGGLATFESGNPLNVYNGLDADGIGGNFDRPDFNPAGKAGVRARYDANSPTLYVNPDVLQNGQPVPINPAEARYIGLPAFAGNVPLRTGNAGRNTERLPWINNWDMNLTKTIKMTERIGLQLRMETYNTFNHPQYTNVSVSPFTPGFQGVGANVVTTPSGLFLRPEFAEAGGRVLRYQMKVTF